jgi:hypothetical protein
MSKPRTLASKDLKAFLDANKRDTRLMGAIERHLLAKPFDNRRMDIIHPSDIIKPEWCALAQYHALLGNYKETREKPSLRLASIFAEGHTIHAKWQTWLQEMGVLYGIWDCTGCGRTDTMELASELNFNDPCGTWSYHEVPLTSAKHKIGGHSDGWVRGLGEDFLIEIKSIGAGTLRFEAPALLAQADNDLEKAWRSIRAPFRTHQLQGQVYLHLCHLMVEEGLLESAPKEIVFIYELKSNQDYKEFTVKYNPEFTADIFDKALDVSWAVDNKRPPVCSIDPVNGCKRCEPHKEAIDAEV